MSDKPLETLLEEKELAETLQVSHRHVPNLAD